MRSEPLEPAPKYDFIGLHLAHYFSLLAYPIRIWSFWAMYIIQCKWSKWSGPIRVFLLMLPDPHGCYGNLHIQNRCKQTKMRVENWPCCCCRWFYEAAVQIFYVIRKRQRWRKLLCGDLFQAANKPLKLANGCFPFVLHCWWHKRLFEILFDRSDWDAFDQIQWEWHLKPFSVVFGCSKNISRNSLDLLKIQIWANSVKQCFIFHV